MSKYDDLIPKWKKMRKTTSCVNISKVFGVSPAIVDYWTSDECKKTRAKYNKLPKVKKKQREHSKKYLARPAGRNSVAKSWVKHYLKNGSLALSDLEKIISDLK
jgi:Zn-dependent peptidase ImmA (M78 family)